MHKFIYNKKGIGRERKLPAQVFGPRSRQKQPGTAEAQPKTHLQLRGVVGVRKRREDFGVDVDTVAGVDFHVVDGSGDDLAPEADDFERGLAPGGGRENSVLHPRDERDYVSGYVGASFGVSSCHHCRFWGIERRTVEKMMMIRQRGYKEEGVCAEEKGKDHGGVSGDKLLFSVVAVRVHQGVCNTSVIIRGVQPGQHVPTMRSVPVPNTLGSSLPLSVGAMSS